jgi:hypothetical protein
MATTTRATLFTALGNRLGFFHAGTATASESAANLVTDTELVQYDTNRIPSKYVRVSRSAGIGAPQVRQALSIASGVITINSAWTGGSDQFVNSGDPYQILEYHPLVLLSALEQAIRNVGPSGRHRGLFKLLADESIIVDNLLANPSFETSESTGTITTIGNYDSTIEGTTLITDATHGLTSGDTVTISGTTSYNGVFIAHVIDADTFYIDTVFVGADNTGTWVEGVLNQEGTASGWTATSGTWTFPSATRRVHGNRSASCTSAGSLTQDLYSVVNVRDMVSKTLHVRGWAFAATASTARIRVSLDGGSTFTNDDYHVAENEWEYLSLDVTIAADSTSLRVDLQAGTGDFFDLVHAWIDTVSAYPLPLEITGGLHKVEQQANEDRPNGPYFPIGANNPPRSGRILRLTGVGSLTVPTTEQGVVEVSEQEAEVIVALAASYAHRTLEGREPGNAKFHAAAARDFAVEAAILKEQHGRKFPPAEIREGWTVNDDGGIKELILVR